MPPPLTTESMKINDLCQNKLCFVCYCIWLYMGVTVGSYANNVLCNGSDNV